MEDRIRWLTHKGQRILRVDYSRLRGKEFLEIIAQVPSFYASLAPGSICCLVDVTDAYVEAAAVDALKHVVKVTKGIDRKGAVLGVTGIKAALLMAVNLISDHKLKPFSSEEEALDWLAT